MVSGVTGEEFAADIFIGPVYYQRLRHMVSDKFQVRENPDTFSWIAIARHAVQSHKHIGVRSNFHTRLPTELGDTDVCL